MNGHMLYHCIRDLQEKLIETSISIFSLCLIYLFRKDSFDEFSFTFEILLILLTLRIIQIVFLLLVVGKLNFSRVKSILIT